MSSTCDATCGNSSDTSIPLCPYFLNENGLGISGPGCPCRTTRSPALPVERLAGVLRQRRLGIERVHVADAAAHEQRDHAPSRAARNAAASARTGWIRSALPASRAVCRAPPQDGCPDSAGTRARARSCRRPTEQELAPRPASFCRMHGAHLTYTNSLRLSSTSVKSTSARSDTTVQCDRQLVARRRARQRDAVREVDLLLADRRRLRASRGPRTAAACRSTNSSFRSVNACVGTVDTFRAPDVMFCSGRSKTSNIGNASPRLR